MIEKTYWGKEYSRLDNIIPPSDPYKKIKTRLLKQVIVCNAILLLLMIVLDIVIVSLIIVSKAYVLAIFIPFTIIAWLISLFLYFIVRKHHNLITIKKKYSLENLLKKP